MTYDPYQRFIAGILWAALMEVTGNTLDHRWAPLRLALANINRFGY